VYAAELTVATEEARLALCLPLPHRSRRTHAAARAVQQLRAPLADREARADVPTANVAWAGDGSSTTEGCGSGSAGCRLRSGCVLSSASTRELPAATVGVVDDNNDTRDDGGEGTVDAGGVQASAGTGRMTADQSSPAAVLPVADDVVGNVSTAAASPAAITEPLVTNPAATTDGGSAADGCKSWPAPATGIGADSSKLLPLLRNRLGSLMDDFNVVAAVVVARMVGDELAGDGAVRVRRDRRAKASWWDRSAWTHLLASRVLAARRRISLSGKWMANLQQAGNTHGQGVRCAGPANLCRACRCVDSRCSIRSPGHHSRD